MSEIILPRRFKAQPQYPAPLDRSHWLAKDITFAITGAFPDFNAATGKRIAITGGGTGFSRRAITSGLALYTPDGGWADLNVEQDWKGANTLILLCRVNSIVDSYGGLFTKNAVEGTTQFAVGKFSVEDNLYATVNAVTDVPRVVSSSINSLAVLSTLVFTHSGVAGEPISFSQNGSYVGATNNNQGTQASGTGVLRLGGEPSSSASYDSDADWLVFIRVNRVLSSAEIRVISENVWAPWQSEKRRLWVVPTGPSYPSGTIAFTEEDDTLSASGTTTIKGSLSVAEADDAVASSGTTTVKGAIAVTEADDTVSGAGAVGSGVTGAIAFTEADDVIASSGTTTVKGTVSILEADDIVSASGTVVSPVTGTILFTEDDDVVAISGLVPASGVVLFTEEDDTVRIVAIAIPGWTADEPVASSWSQASSATGTWTKDLPLL